MLAITHVERDDRRWMDLGSRALDSKTLVRLLQQGERRVECRHTAPKRNGSWCQVSNFDKGPCGTTMLGHANLRESRYRTSWERVGFKGCPGTVECHRVPEILDMRGGDVRTYLHTSG